MAGLVLSTNVEAAEWAEQFTIPFAAQIVHPLGTQAPDDHSATVTTVAGLNIDDPILIDASDGGHYSATVTDIDPAGHVVTWTPALPTGVIAGQNGFIRSKYSLSLPQQSAIDGQGLIYTTDSNTDRIVVFNANGTVLWTLGSHGRIYSDETYGLSPGDEDYTPCNPACPNDPGKMLGQFFLPSGIDVSPDGSTIIVDDSNNHRVIVYQLDPNGAIAATSANATAAPRFDAYAIGGFGTIVGQFVYPSAVSLSASGRIAVADWGNDRIEVFTPSQTGTIAGSDGAHSFTGLKFGHGGSDLTGPGDPAFRNLSDVEFDKSGIPATDGRIVVADTDNHRVQIFTTSGTFVTSIQKDVAPSADPGDFNGPEGVTVDEAGRIYVADYANTRIQIFAPSANASSYALSDPNTDVFGTEQTSDPIPGEIAFIGPSGVAVHQGRLVVTDVSGSRLEVLTHADLGIDSPVTVDRASLTLQDPANDTVHVIVRVRNAGAVDLTNVALSATANYPGTFSSVVPAHVDLARAGSATDSATFDFDFKATGLADGSTLHLNLTAAGNAGTVVVRTSSTVDTQIGITPPAGPAISLGTIDVTPTRAGPNQHITVTVPVQNIGGTTLSQVIVTVTTTSTLVTQSTDSVLIASMASHSSLTETFDFTVRTPPSGPSSFVQFNVTVTSVDDGGHPVPDPAHPLTALAPSAPGVEIVADNIAPMVYVTVTPSPNPRSLDGKDWYNGSAMPCAALSCPPPAVLTWPTLAVTAADEANGSGLKWIGWRMVDTSNQPQSDQVGTCSPTGRSILPSTCAIGPNGTLLWNRTLTDMQSRIVLALWAEDQAGNGAATVDQQLACGAPGVPPGITRIGLVTCVIVFVDVQPPILTQGAITLNSNNTEARIAFTDGDPISQVSSLTSPDATLVANGTASGTLILHAEGTSVTAHVVVTDFARNATTFTLPFQGAGQPVLRLDHTPPEAFNRLDPAALGKRCTTTIGGQPVSYACTNKVYGTDNLAGLTTAAFAPIGVLAARWGGDFDDGHHFDRDSHHDNDHDDDRYGHGNDHRIDWHDGDDDHNWDNQSAELHTYSFTDAFVPSSGPAPIQSPNRVTLIEKMRQAGTEARVHVISYQYQQGTVAGPIIKPDWAYKKYDWDTNSDGSLKSLTQKFELRDGWHRTEITATFDARRNLTRISADGPHVECDDHDHRHDRDVDNDDDETVPGLILLRMTTRSGTLKIEYDVHSPVPVPDLAPPVLTLSSSKTVEATSPAGASVTFTSSALDTVDGVLPVTCTAVSGNTFPLGTTTVGCSATDAAGNTAQRSMTVTVLDTTRPTLTVPGDMTVQATTAAGAVVSFAAAATDIADPSVPVSCSRASGSTFPMGATTVTCTAADDAGNKTTGTFKVTVKDSVAPVLTLSATITVNTSSTSGANVSFTVSAMDAISGSRSVSCSPSSGSKFKVGTTSVSCSASDSAGNTATGSFSVIVKKI